MYDTLKKLYTEGRLNQVGLQNAVAKGWITQEQVNGIVAG